MIEIDDSTSPEQTAADLIRAAFSAVCLLQAHDEEEIGIFAGIEKDLNGAFVRLSAIRSVV